MADLIKKVKIKKQDGTYTDYIPIGAEAKNIDMKNGYSVQANIGDIDIEKDGNIIEQINKKDDEEVLYYFNPQSNTLVEPNANTLITGECSIIKAYGKVIMIDTGGVNRSSSVREYLQSIGVNKVDYLIISHWHYDHCTNFYSNMDYIDWSDCICYFPLDVPRAWVTESTSYYNQCMAYANQHCKQIIFPVDWDEFILNKYFKITFYNCGTQAFNEIKEIEDEIEEYAGHGSSYPNQYYFNDYSLLALVQHNGNKILYSGDAMKANQERAYLARFAANVDLYKMHHHGVNNVGDNLNSVVNIQYCLQINPKYVIDMSNGHADKNYASQTDLEFFNNSSIYCPWKEPVVFATRQGHCYQKTNVTKMTLSPSSWRNLYFFISLDNQNIDINYIPDGSYNRPFVNITSLRAYANTFEAKKCFRMVAVFLPCSDGTITSNISNTFNETIPFIWMSYDYYKYGYSAFPMDSYGAFTSEAINKLKKYKIRGYVTSSNENAMTSIYGLSFIPSNDSILTMDDSAKYYSIIKCIGNMTLRRCLISYEEVTKASDVFYWGIRISGQGTVNIQECYFYDCILAVGVYHAGTARICDCSGDNIVKFAGQAGGTIVYERNGLGKTLRNVHLSRPSWTSLTDAICWNFSSNVEIAIDTRDAVCYDATDSRISFEQWLRNVNKYPWDFRNVTPNIVEYQQSLISPVLGVLYSNTGANAYPIDAYGGNLNNYSLGAMTTTPGYDLSVKADEIEYDLNNLQTIGVYNIRGSGAATLYANCPARNNCKIVVSYITSQDSYILQEIFERTGEVYRRIYDGTRNTGNKWSDWETICSALTWSS